MGVLSNLAEGLENLLLVFWADAWALVFYLQHQKNHMHPILSHLGRPEAIYLYFTSGRAKLDGVRQYVK